MNNLVEKINRLNEKVVSINKEQDQVRFKLEAIDEQLRLELNRYKDLTGCDISLEDIDKEYERVAKELATKYEKLEDVINLIERGEIQEANSMLGISMTSSQDVKGTLMSMLEGVTGESTGKESKEVCGGNLDQGQEFFGEKEDTKGVLVSESDKTKVVKDFEDLWG